jgi:uncharacterized membrane protein
LPSLEKFPKSRQLTLLTLLKPGIFKTQKEFRAGYMTPGKPRQPANPERLRGLMRDAMICAATIKWAVDVAVGYDLRGTDETRSEGWFTVQPCACTTLFNQDVKTMDYWLYVTRHTGGVLDALTDGGGSLCVRAEKFTFRRSNSSSEACNKSGGTWVNFRRVAAQAREPNGGWERVLRRWPVLRSSSAQARRGLREMVTAGWEGKPLGSTCMRSGG